MVDRLIQGSGQAPAPARASNAAAAEAAQLDARLELAAKKAALRSLEAQAEPPAAEAPFAQVRSPSGRIVIERDGKTVILDNPTAEQLSSLGLAGSSAPPLEGRQVIDLTGIVMGGIVLLTAITLWYRRTMRGTPVSTAASAQSEARMARIENALESIAVEVERISEGQRFTSRLLAEGAAVPLNSAANAPEMVGAVVRNAGGAQ